MRNLEPNFYPDGDLTSRLTVRHANHYTIERPLVQNLYRIYIELLMMMSSLPEGRSIGFLPPGDEMSEVVSHCLPHSCE